MGRGEWVARIDTGRKKLTKMNLWIFQVIFSNHLPLKLFIRYSKKHFKSRLTNFSKTNKHSRGENWGLRVAQLNSYHMCESSDHGDKENKTDKHKYIQNLDNYKVNYKI